MGSRAAAVLLLAALAACRDSGVDEPETTVPTAPLTSATTTTTALSFEVPATIDTAYVEKVMTGLDHVFGDIARHVASERALDTQFNEMMVVLFGGDSLRLTHELWAKVAEGDFQLLRPRPDDPKTTVKRLVTATRDCVVFEAGRDFLPAFVNPDPPGPARYVGLVPLPTERNLANRNPTTWMITFDGNYSDDRVPTPEEACDATG